jgi:pimeloyl-ACP methyl ester carboxylesterase
MSMAIIGDQPIHYELTGRGKPVIFIHGWLGSWRYWWPAMQGLSTQHRAIAFDLWGFGDSSKLSDCYSVPAYVSMLNNFINYLGITDRVILVGHGLGAVVALRFTITNPDQVERIATVSLPFDGQHLDPRLGELDPENYLNKVLGKSGNFKELMSELHKIDKHAMNLLANEVLNSSYLVDLQKCSRPFLLMHGDNDRVVSTPPEKYMNELNGRSHFVLLKNCNHFPMLEKQAQFNRLLLEFSLAKEEINDIFPKVYWQRRTR